MAAAASTLAEVKCEAAAGALVARARFDTSTWSTAAVQGWQAVQSPGVAALSRDSALRGSWNDIRAWTCATAAKAASNATAVGAATSTSVPRCGRRRRIRSGGLGKDECMQGQEALHAVGDVATSDVKAPPARPAGLAPGA